jgi:hypothetical protein
VPKPRRTDFRLMTRAHGAAAKEEMIGPRCAVAKAERTIAASPRSVNAD